MKIKEVSYLICFVQSWLFENLWLARIEFKQPNQKSSLLLARRWDNAEILAEDVFSQMGAKYYMWQKVTIQTALNAPSYGEDFL